MSRARPPLTRLPLTFDTPLSVPYRHQVHFTRDALALKNPTIAAVLGDAAEGAPRRAIAFIDSGLQEHWPDFEERMRAYFAAHPQAPELTLVETVPGGERAKRGPAVVERVVAAVDEHHIDRQSFVLVAGGGAVMDAVGYAAAIAHRGCKLLRLPSTTLGQDDAGMAVKNGINLKSKKNFIGTFMVPHGVICDEALLETLPEWSWCGGFSEAVKISLLRDPTLFARIERDAAAIRARSMEAAMPVIVRCAELHYRHIMLSGDPFETRSARPLDYGHWLAHRLEGLTAGELPHGQAVAIGVAVDTMYAACAGRLPMVQAQRVLAVLRALGLPTTHALLSGQEALAAGLEEFREHLGGRLTVTLLMEIGRPYDAHEIDARTLHEALALTSAPS